LVRSTRWSWLKAWAMQIAKRRGMDSLKALDPSRPIREADIRSPFGHVRFMPIADIITSFDHLLIDRKHTRRNDVNFCLQKPALPVSRLQRFPKKQQRMATDAPLSWRNV
ncbi:MAG TPA: hypothetical protein VM822_16995, partial [Pseudolabrys sp.]|nr:hypothetical protein [Pseudolabrys sp.]